MTPVATAALAAVEIAEPIWSRGYLEEPNGKEIDSIFNRG
jgi:hypothetical protein